MAFPDYHYRAISPWGLWRRAVKRGGSWARAGKGWEIGFIQGNQASK